MVVRIDVTQFDWLVGQDLGFLIGLQHEVRIDGTRLEVVASSRVADAIECSGIQEHLAIVVADDHDSDAV